MAPRPPGTLLGSAPSGGSHKMAQALRTQSKDDQPPPDQPRRCISFQTFCELPDVTPAIIADMRRRLHDDGYGKIKPATKAVMRRHNLGAVMLYGGE